MENSSQPSQHYLNLFVFQKWFDVKSGKRLIRESFRKMCPNDRQWEQSMNGRECDEMTLNFGVSTIIRISGETLKNASTLDFAWVWMPAQGSKTKFLLFCREVSTSGIKSAAYWRRNRNNASSDAHGALSTVSRPCSRSPVSQTEANNHLRCWVMAAWLSSRLGRGSTKQITQITNSFGMHHAFYYISTWCSERILMNISSFRMVRWWTNQEGWDVRRKCALIESRVFSGVVWI